MITGSDPILPDEMEAAFDHSDISKDSIDLPSSPDDDSTRKLNFARGQHKITSFLTAALPLPTNNTQPAQAEEVEEEDNSAVDSIVQRDVHQMLPMPRLL
jgi:hypothetical protein